jgi:hypothetical protein
VRQQLQQVAAPQAVAPTSKEKSRIYSNSKSTPPAAQASNCINTPVNGKQQHTRVKKEQVKASSTSAALGKLPIATSTAGQSPGRAQAPPVPTSFSDLPLHLQTRLLAQAGAPLNTCRVSKAVLKDMALVPIWLAAGVKRPVLAAAGQGWWQACCQLLSSGCQAQPMELRFALVKAAAARQAKAVSSLIDAGACNVPEGFPAKDVRQVISAAFTKAAGQGDEDVCRVMLEKQVVRGRSVLHQALLSAADNRWGAPVVALLLEAGADANAGSTEYCSFSTPLGKAIFTRNVKMVEMLLKHGAGVHTSSHNISALEYAASYNTGPEMVRLLLKHGARQGMDKAIDKASSGGNWEVLQVLMETSGQPH